ncbi:MAG: EF-P lysine aminoacylase EpmA [Thermodesulfobacteriota bacterium]
MKYTCTSPVLYKRARIIQCIRDFFIERDYLEVETPLCQPNCLPESHLKAARSGDWFLQPSPEQSMKSLLAAGFPRLFQICKCFRSGERGRLHLFEFTMLEWYREGIDYRELMTECEELLKFLACSLKEEISPSWRCRTERPWPRITVDDLFKRYSPLTATEAVRQNVFEQILVERIESHLGFSRPVFVYDYPAALGSLARLKPENKSRAERFELYINGIELANGFSELADSNEQRQRFEKERRLLEKRGENPGPMPEHFLAALDSMPQAAGIALGIDRLIMLCCGLSTIDEAVTLVPDNP